MKRVLMIAHQFPPIGGSGVQRTVKFMKYLPDFGWEASVFTRQARSAPEGYYFEPGYSKKAPQYRSAAWDMSEWSFPLNLAGKYFRRRILIPDGERLWQIFARKSNQHSTN